MALTTKYVSVDADGTGDGSDPTRVGYSDGPWTLSQAVGDTSADKVVVIMHHSLNGDGTASGLSSYKRNVHTGFTGQLTGAGGLRSFFVGYNSAGNPAQSNSDGPMIDFDGLATGNSLYLYQSQQGVHGLILEDCYGYALRLNDAGSVNLVTVQNSRGTFAIGTNYEGAVTNCLIKDCTGSGIAMLSNRCDALFNRIWSVTSTGIALPLGSTALGNYVRGCATGLSLSGDCTVMLNTVDACTTSGMTFSSYKVHSILMNIISNCAVGITGAAGTYPLIYALNDLYNNTADFSVFTTASAGLTYGNVDIDPDYVAIASNDFEIQETTLKSIDENFNLNIGAWQGASTTPGDPIPLSAYCLGVSAMEINTIYPGKENAIGIKVYEDGVRRTNLTALTRCRVIFGGVEVDSSTTAAAFTLAYDDADGNDVILLDFGELASTLPEGDWSATIIIYESTRPDGFVCAEGYPIRIKTPQTGTVLTS